MEDTTNKQSEPEEQQLEEQPKLSRKNWLYESLDLSRWVHYTTIISNLPFILFIAALGIVYIANAHYAESNVREMNQLEKEMNEMRWDYMTTQSDLEYMSKQSEVARMVAPSGLEELQDPPQKIELKKNER